MMPGCPKCREQLPPDEWCDACQYCGVCKNWGTITTWRGSPLRRVVDWCRCIYGEEAQAHETPPPSEGELMRHFHATYGGEA